MKHKPSREVPLEELSRYKNRSCIAGSQLPENSTRTIRHQDTSKQALD
jgi:hypothetical protein